MLENASPLPVSSAVHAPGTFVLEQLELKVAIITASAARLLQLIERIGLLGLLGLLRVLIQVRPFKGQLWPLPAAHDYGRTILNVPGGKPLRQNLTFKQQAAQVTITLVRYGVSLSTLSRSDLVTRSPIT